MPASLCHIIRHLLPPSPSICSPAIRRRFGRPILADPETPQVRRGSGRWRPAQVRCVFKKEFSYFAPPPPELAEANHRPMLDQVAIFADARRGPLMDESHSALGELQQQPRQRQQQQQVATTGGNKMSNWKLDEACRIKWHTTSRDLSGRSASLTSFASGQTVACCIRFS